MDTANFTLPDPALWLGAALVTLAVALAQGGVHTLIERRVPFQLTFRLTRGLVSTVLTAVGFFVLIRGFHRWPQAWVVHDQGPVTALLLGFPLGHLAIDAALMIRGARRFGERPRTDLILHHLMAVVAGTIALVVGVAQELFLILFTSELMPVTTGLAAVGTLTGDKRVERLGGWLRLVVLLGWRLPLWAVVGVLLTYNLASYPGGDPMRLFILLASAGFVAPAVALDIYWVRASLRALRRGVPAESPTPSA